MNQVAKHLAKIFLLTGVLLVSAPASASTDLATGSTILFIAANNDSSYWVSLDLQGGTGPCANQTVKFPKSSMSEADARTVISLATVAFVNNKTIRVVNYDSGSCTGADYIRINQ